jgi:hypothetical protein
MNDSIVYPFPQAEFDAETNSVAPESFLPNYRGCYKKSEENRTEVINGPRSWEIFD